MSRSISLLISGAVWLVVRYRSRLGFPHLVALLVVLPFLGYLVYAAMPVDEPANTMRVREFGKVYVQDNGRIKPIDTLARVNLLIISGRQSYHDENGDEHPAIEWLLDVATSSFRKERSSAKVKAFRVDDAQIRRALGVEDRQPPLYSFAELPPAQVLRQAIRKRLEEAGEDDRDDLYKQVLDLALQLEAYSGLVKYETPHQVFRIDNDQLLGLLGLEGRSGYRYSFGEFVPHVSQLFHEAERIKKVPKEERSAYEKKAFELANHVQLYAALANLQTEFLQVIPPAYVGDSWRSFSDAAEQAEESGKTNPAMARLSEVLNAYAKGDAARFNQAVTEYRGLLDRVAPSESGVTRFEVWFNHFQPFYQCTILYVFVFLFACFSWVGWSEPLRQTAFWLCILAIVVQTGAILARMIMQGRPPVTNLYSSAVFVGWGCVVLGLILEGLYPYGIASAAAAVLGFATSLLAHHLGGSGDSLEMLQAVLDTNFWLATHVTAVTIGYAATLTAGVLGIQYILYGLIAKPGGASRLKNINNMIYGIVCFATLFSFTGTVLGGIWADQSWGRFWGWDPKENGALIIVIWNALLLHARWAGLIRQRGLAVLSVAGIMVTIWSWIGTNQLEIGLHAYGFNSTLAKVARYTWIGCLGFILVGGLTPLRYWRALRLPASALDTVPAKGRLKPAQV